MKSYEIRKVLVAVDFSEVSINALNTAISLCRKHQASLILIHVIENTRFLYTAAGGLAAVALLPELMRTAEERLGDLAIQIRSSQKLNVSQCVRTGHPAEAICQEAFRSEVDLVVVGSHGTSSVRQLIIGSTAYFVVKSSPAPVLTVPGSGVWTEFAKILFPVRADSFAYEKYDFVYPIIRKESASVLLTGILDKASSVGHCQIESIIRDLHARCVADSLMCDVKVYECKHMATQVLDIANHEKPDLVVITTTISSTIWDFFTVAYPAQIVSHATVPVLSIRPHVEVDAQIKAAQYIDDRLVTPSIAFG